MTRPLLALPALWLAAALPGSGIAAWPVPAPVRPAEIIEMPVPLPLPGQLKPAPERDTGPRGASAKPVSPVRAITEGARPGSSRLQGPVSTPSRSIRTRKARSTGSMRAPARSPTSRSRRASA